MNNNEGRKVSYLCTNKPIIQLISIIFICCRSQLLYAETIPSIVIYKEINFGEVLLVPGNCTMNHIDGSFTSATPDKMCGSSGNGTRGHFIVVAPPNKQVSLKISQRNNEGDGIVFIPEGELVSDTETIAITPNITQLIDSGSSGNVNIYVGGQLLISTHLPSNNNFQITNENGIEWSVLP